MGITFINRITGASNNQVYIETTDSTAVARAAGYITAQANNIAAANQSAGGLPSPFQWDTNDCIMLSASDGLSWCTINSTFTTLRVFASDVDPFIIREADFTLTASQFINMYTTPISVLPAQGANKIIALSGIALELVYGTTQFTGGGVVGFQYGNTAHLAGTLATGTQAAAGFTGATANTSFTFFPAVLANATSGIANTALYISNQTAVFAAGDSTFVGKIFYRVISV